MAKIRDSSWMGARTSMYLRTSVRDRAVLEGVTSPIKRNFSNLIFLIQGALASSHEKVR